jgi:hypothetical protein
MQTFDAPPWEPSGWGDLLNERVDSSVRLIVAAPKQLPRYPNFGNLPMAFSRAENDKNFQTIDRDFEAFPFAVECV